jgi:Peptidase family M48
MSRPSAAALGCGAVLVVAAFLSHVAGESYRSTLLKTRRADLLARLIVPEEHRPDPVASIGTGNAPPETRVASAGASEPMVKEKPEPAPPPEKEKPAPAPPAREIPPPVVAAASRTPDTAPREKPTPPAVPASGPAPPPALELPPNLLSMTREQEEQTAITLDQLIRSKNHILNDIALQQRVTDTIRPLMPARKRKELSRYRYGIIDSDEVSTFSQLGGYIYLSRGAFRLAANDVELQFLLAREMAHIDANDCARLLAHRDSARTTADPDPPARTYARLVAALPEEAEFQADIWAYRQLIRLGHSPYQILGFLRRYLKYAEEKQAYEERAAAGPAFDNPDSKLENHWRKLPSPVDRLERLREVR